MHSLEERACGHPARIPLPEGSIVTVTDRTGRYLVRSREPEKYVGRSGAPIDPAVLPRSSLRAGLDGVDRYYGDAVASGGLHRALLAAPPILLLDESTSSLDGMNERMMREAIDAVSAGRTLIVIAHRLSTVVDSDRIIVLDGGTVIGEGTHGELVASVPLYRDLAAHQLLV